MRRRVGVVTLVFMIAVVAWGTPPTEARTGLTTTSSVPLQLAAWTGTAHYQQNKGLEYDCQTGQGAGHCRTFINWSIDYSISRTGVTNGTTFVGHWFYRETFDPDQPPTFGCYIKDHVEYGTTSGRTTASVQDEDPGPTDNGAYGFSVLPHTDTPLQEDYTNYWAGPGAPGFPCPGAVTDKGGYLSPGGISVHGATGGFDDATALSGSGDTPGSPFNVTDGTNVYGAVGSWNLTRLCDSDDDGLWSLVGVTADVTFTVDFVSGFHLNSLHLACRHAAVGMLELDGLSLDYEELESTWKGQATAILPFEGDPELTVAVEIQNGDLKSLGVEVGNLNKPIGAVWFLQKLGFEMARDPVTLTGTAGVTALPQVSFAGQDYSVASIDGHITIPLDRRAAFSLSGELHVVDEPLADGSLTYTLSKSVLAGHIDFQDAGFGAEGDLNGWVEPDAASLEGQADVTLEGHAISEGRAVISTVGIAACGAMFGGLLGGGWGRTWDQILPRPFSGCDLSAYAPIGSTHRVPVAAPVSQQVTLPGGLTAAAIEISGDLGTPYVTVNGPNGETLVTPTDPGNEGYVGNQFFVVTNPYRDSTDIMIKQPAAGIWTIESQPSSVPIVGISVSKSLPSPVVAAGVSGVGQHRTLHWTLTPHPGQVVQFMEQGSDVDRVIATTSLASGSADFKPAAGLPGVRDIRALVSQDGLPRTTIPLGTYQAPKATSSLSLQAHRTSRSVIASGELKPEHLGSPVTITLRRKFQGQVTLLAKRKVLLGPGTKPGHSVYAATFRRPQGGTCLITTRYGGDAVYAAVSKTLRIAC